MRKFILIKPDQILNINFSDIEYSIDEVADPNGRKIYTNKHNMFKDFHQKRKLKNAKVKPRIETIRLDYDTIEQSKVLKTEGRISKVL